MDISVVIPAYERAALLRDTLESLAASEGGFQGEAIVVDDGSATPLEEQLAALGFEWHPVADVELRFVRQENAGSLVARLAGLREARGDFIQFIDSDDEVRPAKLAKHLDAMRSTGADLSYCWLETIRKDAGGGRESLGVHRSRECAAIAEFCFRVQPTPVAYMVTRALAARLLDPIVPPDPWYGPVGDLWLLLNMAPAPGRVAMIPEPLGVYVKHGDYQYTDEWEILGLTSSGATAEFIAAARGRAEAAAALSECARGWGPGLRKQPRWWNDEFEPARRRMFEALPRGEIRLEGRMRWAAAVLGPYRASLWWRNLRRHSYASCARMEPDRVRDLKMGLADRLVRSGFLREDEAEVAMKAIKEWRP